MKSLYLKGLKFGMILQLAVGPMCLMVFNTSRTKGFLIALSLVIAIAIIDAFYITLAGIGVSKILENKKVKLIFSVVGSMVLIVFGLNIILNTFDINIIPGLNIAVNSKVIFIQGLLLTLSNPLTIVFWGSILTTKIIEDKMNKKEIILFSLGLISSTLIFLTFIAILGMLLSTFIPNNIAKILNILVGCLIIYFGIKMLIKKR